MQICLRGKKKKKKMQPAAWGKWLRDYLIIHLHSVLWHQYCAQTGAPHYKKDFDIFGEFSDGHWSTRSTGGESEKAGPV